MTSMNSLSCSSHHPGSKSATTTLNTSGHMFLQSGEQDEKLVSTRLTTGCMLSVSLRFRFLFITFILL